MAAPGFCLYVVGRLRGIPRGRLAAAVQAAGGHLVRTPSSRVDLVAVSHSSALCRRSREEARLKACVTLTMKRPDFHHLLRRRAMPIAVVISRRRAWGRSYFM